MLTSLIKRHPEAEKKIGCGIKRLYKAPTDKGTSCFWIERLDSTKTDFSYGKAITSKNKSLEQEFKDACRNAVELSLKASKEKFFKEYADENGCVECEVSKTKVAVYESHLDHKKPLTFEVIVETFIKANKIEVTEDMLSLGKDGQFQTEFRDLEIKERFIKYHASVAKLRIIKANINLKLGASERILKIKRPVSIDIT